MGLCDKQNLDKVKKAINEHEGQVDNALSKVADFADKQTGGKYTDKIDKAVRTAQDRTGRL